MMSTVMIAVFTLHKQVWYFPDQDPTIEVNREHAVCPSLHLALIPPSAFRRLFAVRVALALLTEARTDLKIAPL